MKLYLVYLRLIKKVCLYVMFYLILAHEKLHFSYFVTCIPCGRCFYRLRVSEPSVCLVFNK